LALAGAGGKNFGSTAREWACAKIVGNTAVIASLWPQPKFAMEIEVLYSVCHQNVREGFMALPKAYLTSTRNLSGILNAIQGAKAPPKFTQRFLESLEFKSPNDRLIIGVLKALRFLNDDGSPTNRYFAFLDQTQSARILAEGIREAYDDLFQVNVNAQLLSKAELINKFKTLSQGQLSDAVLDKMALTFSELCKLADFKAETLLASEAAVSETPPNNKDGQGAINGRIKIEGLVYNIYLSLPESRDPAVYAALFRSLREHLG
jgi:Family of unknown function (DUF5343)